MPFRITTWNVNGIRNPFGYQPWRENRTFQAMFDTLEADIVVMQEAKIQRKDLKDDMVLVPGWDVYFSLPKHKKGYSGVAIYTRSSKCSPIRAEEGITGVLCPPNSSTKFRDLPLDQQIGGYPKPGQLSDVVDDATLDSEGRCVILEFPAFVLIGVYSPATRDETRVEFRQAYIDAIDTRVRNLAALGKQVFLCGDLNIIRSELDTAGLADQLRKEAMTIEDFLSTPSRRFLNQIVFGGQVFGERDAGREKPVLWDICREFHPTRAGMYTCWDTRKNARPGNFGSRIDYVLCTSGIKDWFIDSNIQEGLLGSDHCPVYATVGDTVSRNGTQVPITDLMNPSGVFKGGERQREWTAKDLLPTSAKLIPEFDRRRSIKDMFFKKATVARRPGSAPSSQPVTPQSSPGNSNTPVPNSPSKDESTPASQKLSQSRSVPQSSNSTTESSPQKPSASKRPAESSSASSRPQKRGKATLTKETSKSGAGAGQKSLMGFFKPKNPVAQSNSATDAKVTEKPMFQEGDANTSAESRDQEGGSEPGTNTAGEEGPDKTPKTSSQPSEKVHDPIVAKESWSKILGKRVVPRCEHGEDCQSLVTKKPGINCGRSFFVCARPTGPSGGKEKNTEFRCSTFIWSSDWNGRP
ncbi:Endonuclease/exonuclease/phosphatase [Cladorrhinum sp. PSN332]|nr:Endonuclease/exonuclease/phosphatase [Cladorrhinum sp. PSN332]